MSCKYCELKLINDDGVAYLAGEDWEDEHGEDGGYIHPDGEGFAMTVYYDARYAATGIYGVKFCPFCGAELENKFLKKEK